MFRPGRTRKIAVIDFGSSCFAHETVYTYIQSRFYRSPEIILGLPYDHQIDMWSLGCVLAELYIGQPLFPGSSEKQQIASFAATLGNPPLPLLQKATRSGLYFNHGGEPLSLVAARGVIRPPLTQPLVDRLPSAPLAFVNFLGRCLDWDPATRITPAEASRHEWIRSRGHCVSRERHHGDHCRTSCHFKSPTTRHSRKVAQTTP